jgi:HPt (histidine-containing phosphotransfer) domain-containing protein
MEQGHAAGVQQAAHSLKGSSRYVGASRVASLSAALEERSRRGAVDGESTALLGQLAAAFARAQELLSAKEKDHEYLAR